MGLSEQKNDWNASASTSSEPLPRNTCDGCRSNRSAIAGFECFRVRIRVNCEFCGVKRAQNLGHGRRGRVRVFVGVQLDDVVGFGCSPGTYGSILRSLSRKGLSMGRPPCVRFL